MRRFRGAPMILALLLLCGCAGGAREEKAAETIQTRYAEYPSFTAQAEVLADYGERAYAYTVEIEGSGEQGSLTVLKPDSIAGAGTAWEAGQTKLDYEGISLETGELSPDGLSPADAIPTLWRCVSEGLLLEWGTEQMGETECVYLRCQNPDPNAKESTVSLWADPESGCPRQAELYWGEERVITFSFTQFDWAEAR